MAKQQKPYGMTDMEHQRYQEVLELRNQLNEPLYVNKIKEQDDTIRNLKEENNQLRMETDDQEDAIKHKDEQIREMKLNKQMFIIREQELVNKINELEKHLDESNIEYDKKCKQQKNEIDRLRKELFSVREALIKIEGEKEKNQMDLEKHFKKFTDEQEKRDRDLKQFLIEELKNHNGNKEQASSDVNMELKGNILQVSVGHGNTGSNKMNERNPMHVNNLCPNLRRSTDSNKGGRKLKYLRKSTNPKK